MRQVLTSPGCRTTARTCSVLFSDVVASTSMIDAEGDLAWMETLDRHRRLVHVLAEHHHGAVSNFVGDGFMILFDDAADAVTCALRIQEASCVQQLLGIRIGIDHGDIHPYQDDWWVGRTIHVASRLTDLCEAGEVILSQHCAERALERIALPHSTESIVRLAGFCEPSIIHVVRPTGRP